MHDKLYENQIYLGMDGLRRYAEELGLDVKALNDAMRKQAIEDRINKDFEGGARSGVNGTPTFFVNGERYDGDWNYKPFLEALTSILVKQGKDV